MTSKLVVNTIEADTGISSVSFGSSISLSSTSKFHFGNAGIDIGADTNINRPSAGVLGFNINSSEKVRITSNGNILVGKTADAGKGLEIYASNNAALRVQNSHTGQGTGDGLLIETSFSDTLIWNYENSNTRFGTNGTERLRITSTGIIVAGNSGTPFGNAQFQAFIAHGNTAGESGFASIDTTSVAAGVGGEISFHGKYNTGAQDYAYLGHIRGIKENATAGNTACALLFHTRPNATAPQERLRIKSDGDVIWNGIGTQLPGEGNTTVGMGFEPRNGTIFLSRADNALILSNRNNDGRHIHFNQGGTGKFAIGLQNSGANLTFFSGAGNSPSPKVHITSSGQLCIGTPTAVRALTIKDPGQIHVESTSTGNWVGMSIKGSSGTNNYNAYFGILDSNGNFFIDNGSNGNDFVINPSGQITQPSQTSVMARPPGNYTIPGRDSVIAGTWTTNTTGCHNIGNDFNTSGGIYTAPVAGRYLVQWNIFLTNNTTRRDAYVQLNGSDVIREEIGDPEGTTGNNKNVSCQAVINMSANDVLRFGALTTGGTTVYNGVTPWSYCCVRLLG